MRLREFLSVVVLLGLVHPAQAVVRTWRAEGTVDNVQGTVSLLPLAAVAGDPMVIEFSYDDAAPDQLADPNIGRFAVVSSSVTIGGETLDFLGPEPIQNRIQTQLAGSFDSWILSTCRAECDPDDDDEARVGFFLPAGSRGGDALLPQPQLEDADSTQFLLRSVNESTAEEAFIVGDFEALVYVPEPGAPLSLAAGVLALVAAQRRRR
jgi:uncharacterized protein (TIGR03382 family)